MRRRSVGQPQRRATTRVALECLEDRTLPDAQPLAVLAQLPAPISSFVAQRVAAIAENLPPEIAVKLAPVAAPPPADPTTTPTDATGTPATVTVSASSDPTTTAVSVTSPTDATLATSTVGSGTTATTSTTSTSDTPGTGTLAAGTTGTGTLAGTGSLGPAAGSSLATPQTHTMSPTATAAASSPSFASPFSPTGNAGPGVTGSPGGSGSSAPGANGGETTTSQNSTTPSSPGNPEGEGDPVLNAVLSRVLPGLGSSLFTLVSGRVDGLRLGQVTQDGWDSSAGIDPPPFPVLATGVAAGASGVTTALLGDGIPGSPAQVFLAIEAALGFSLAWGTNTGALRPQGIDFRPLNGSGVGVVGTVLAGVEAGSEEQRDPAEGDAPLAPAKVVGLDLADGMAPPATDAGLKQFLLGLEPPADAPLRDALGAPVLLAGPANAAVARNPIGPVPPGSPMTALDAACAEGFDSRTGDVESTGTGQWTGTMFLLVSPILFLSWSPEAKRKNHPAPASPRLRP